MIIFLNEERAFCAWLARHRAGFVLDGLRQPTRKQPSLHRATCQEVRVAKAKRSHWTTGRHFKACSLDRQELLEWANSECAGGASSCDQCKSAEVIRAEALMPREAGPRPLTKQGGDIIDYVLDVALIHLGQGNGEYDLTVGDLAQYLAKTRAQVSPAIIRLLEDGYLRTEGDIVPGAALPTEQPLFPTARAMRILPAFEKLPEQEIEAELVRLLEVCETARH
jgi:hypothetical protein